MKVVPALVVALLLGGAVRADQADEDRPTIDVVFCIDCSGSMGGVIDTAKRKVWSIVNELAKARPAPVLRIGLIGYGNGPGPFRQFDLSDDLDEVYKNLMTFKDEGWGDEFVGLAVHQATDQMKWSAGSRVLKVIYVVGNETARQGPAEFDYTRTAPQAVSKGICINAVYCGDTDYQAATPTWRELAKLADGQYLEIAANGGAILVNTQYDDELARLNQQLNATYLGYGARGRAGAANQVAQDSAALSLGAAVAAERAAAKSAPMYRNAGWDLVDASAAADFDISKIKDEDLPEEVRKIEPGKRAEYVQAKAKERAQVQAQIKELAAKREAVVQEELKKRGSETDSAFDQAVKRSITEEAKNKGFEFQE